MKKILIILSFFLSLSCELEKEIDNIFVYGGNKIVVRGFISKEDGVYINLKKTVDPTNSNDDDILGNTKVMLFKNNVFYAEIPRLDENHFVLNENINISNNDHFNIEVWSQGMDNVISSNQLIFEKTHISNIVFDTLQNKLQLQFTKNLKEEKYILQQSGYKNNETVDYSRQSLEIFNENVGLQQVVAPFYRMDYDSIQIKLIKLSPDYFKFVESLDFYNYTYDNSFFETVTPVYSNIQSGYGIFGSYAYDKKTYIP